MPQVKKLEEKHYEVIALLRKGWELGVNTFYEKRNCWMQAKRLGSGEESRNLHQKMVQFLVDMGVIRKIEERGTVHVYGLTEAWSKAISPLRGPRPKLDGSSEPVAADSGLAEQQAAYGEA